MLIIKVKKGGTKSNLESALKELKSKFKKSGILKEVRKRREYVKPSKQKRIKIQKAKYRNEILREIEDQ